MVISINPTELELFKENENENKSFASGKARRTKNDRKKIPEEGKFIKIEQLLYKWNFI